MAISPINAALKNNYNLSFEANKKNKHKNPTHSNTSMTLKAIPLAALMAMAPINDAYSQNVIKEGLTTRREITNLDGTPAATFVYNIPGPLKRTSQKLIFTSSDGDDIPEEVRHIETEKDEPVNYRDENGVSHRALLNATYRFTGKTLVRKHYKSSDGGYYHYYLRGYARNVSKYTDRENPEIVIRPFKETIVPDAEMPLSKKVYDIISDTMGDKIERLDIEVEK